MPRFVYFSNASKCIDLLPIHLAYSIQLALKASYLSHIELTIYARNYINLI